MMRNAFCLAAAIVFVPFVVTAQETEKPGFIDGVAAPPLLAQIGEVQIADGQLQIDRINIRQVPVIEQRVVIENGVAKTVMETKYVFETSIERRRFSLVKGQVFTADQKQVPDKKLAELLIKGQVVMVSGDKSGHIGKDFLKILKPETIVLLGTLEQ